MGCFASKTTHVSFDPKAPGLTQEFQSYSLIKKDQVTHDSYIFTFSLQTPSTNLSLPTGQHLMLKYKPKDSDNEIQRPYTPISDNDLLGEFKLLVKIYSKGKMTNYLNSLKINDKILGKGPLGHITYIQPNIFNIKKGNDNNINYNINKIGMIAGGTGITPCYQILNNIYKNRNENNTQIILLFSNKTLNDILLKKELDNINMNDNKVKVIYTLSNFNENEKKENNWENEIGRIDENMILKYMYEPNDDTMILLCGPPKFEKSIKKILNKIGHNDDHILRF